MNHVSRFRRIDDLCKSGEVDQARRLFDELFSVAERERDSALRLDVAAAGGNLIIAYRKAGRIDEAQTLCRKIEQLAPQHPKETDLQFQVCRAVSNLVGTCGELGDIPGARSAFERLEVLSTPYRDTPEVRSLLATAACPLIISQASSGQIDEAVAVHGRLSELVNAYPTDAEICRQWAMATDTLANSFMRRKALEKARELFDAMGQVSLRHRDDSTIRVWHTKCAASLVVSYGEQDRLIDAGVLYGTLQLPTRPSRSESVSYAHAARYLGIKNGREGDLTNACEYLERARAILSQVEQDAAARVMLEEVTQHLREFGCR